MEFSMDKWTKHKALIKNEQLKPYLPETTLLDKETFWDLMERYGKVVVKPSMGSFGRGVTYIKKAEDNEYEFWSEMNKVRTNGKEQTFQNVQRYLIKEENIVQQAVTVGQIKGAPFDLRVMVQRKKGSRKWAVTGMVAKVAAENYFVTNAAGRVLHVQAAFEESNIKTIDSNALIKEIENIALLAAKQLSRYYPKQRVFGLDIGIDIEGKPWIFEANCNPFLVLFEILKDEKMLNKIKEFKRNRGRSRMVRYKKRKGN
ncbi:YheC/YheD family protein [Bacillus sp. Marseille-P3661]|uniref:YheC/YheD family protein n=1 Tax=Bacillus sp. Marseille-P3661 TaxID=1936234 RepID=UPI000C82C51B|nr:YheC/YheD family protein [Bacillus sp. Marseille-P3661]